MLVFELKSINHFKNKYDNVNQESMRENIAYLTQSNYAFALTENYENL